MGRHIKNLRAQEFGYLVALWPTRERRSGSPVWRCRCSKRLGGCGRLHQATARDLIHHHVKSCGCLRNQQLAFPKLGKQQRNSEVLQMIRRGVPVLEVAGTFGVSRQRIQQIVKGAKVS